MIWCSGWRASDFRMRLGQFDDPELQVAPPLLWIAHSCTVATAYSCIASLPQPWGGYGLERVDTPAHRELAMSAALQGFVLLQVAQPHPGTRAHARTAPCWQLCWLRGRSNSRQGKRLWRRALVTGPAATSGWCAPQNNKAALPLKPSAKLAVLGPQSDQVSSLLKPAF